MRTRPRAVGLLVLPLALAGCDKEAAPPPEGPAAAATGSQIIFALPREPDTLIPMLARSEEALYLSELIFDGLINKTTVTSTGRALYSEALCKRYTETQEDRREITLELDMGATWHNGVPFSADDVIYTWDALHASDAPITGWLDSLVEKVYKSDKDELRITLKVERSQEALYEIFSTFKVLPRVYDPARGDEGLLPPTLNDNSGIVNDFSFRPVGTGPYQVAKRSGNQIELSRNANYFLGPPKIESMRMQRMEAPELAVRSLVDQSIQLIPSVGAAFHGQLDQADVRSLDYAPYGFVAIAYNARRAAFRDPAFRQALNRATDKAALFMLYTELKNPKEYVSTSVYPPNFEFVRTSPESFVDPTPHAPGPISGGSFKFLVSSEIQGLNAKKLAQAWSEGLQQAGVRVEIDDANMASYDQALREHTFDAALVYYTGLNHLYDLRGLFGPDNLFGIQDAELSGLLEAYGTTFNWVELERLSKEIHRRVGSLAPACFLFTPPRRAYMTSRLANVSIHPEVGFATAERWELN